MTLISSDQQRRRMDQRAEGRMGRSMRTSTSLFIISSLSCANGFSPLLAHRWTGTLGSENSVSYEIRPQTCLRYRDGDEEDCPLRRSEHKEASANLLKALVGRSASKSKYWLSQVYQKPKRTHGNDKQQQEQYKLDDYLRYIDKRYHFLHDDEKKGNDVAASSGVNTAWSWLAEEKPLSSTRSQAAQQDDALHVLGLAELASERLLQKRYSPSATSQSTQFSYTTDPSVIDTSIEPSQGKSRINQVVKSMSIVHQWHLRNTAMLSIKARAIAFGIIRGWVKVISLVLSALPTAVETLLKLGGGRKLVQGVVVATVSVAMFLTSSISQA